MKIKFIDKEIEIPAMITDEFLNTHPNCIIVSNNKRIDNKILKKKLDKNKLYKVKNNL